MLLSEAKGMGISMKIGVLGSGKVGQTIAGKLAAMGQQVMIGTRDPQKLTEWQQKTGENAWIGSFKEAAAFGEIVFNATSGSGSIEALQLAGSEQLGKKILIDLSNPLDFSQGMPPILFVSNTDSLGEQIQRTFPDVKVVKGLNTLPAPLMVNPTQLADGDHNLFICGNDNDAKNEVKERLQQWFGWKSGAILDMGDIKAARGTEAILPFSMSLWGVLGTPVYNLKVVHQSLSK